MGVDAIAGGLGEQPRAQARAIALESASQQDIS
jgi:hypothetical protein